RADIEIDDLGRRRLQHHLILIIVLQPVRVLAIAAILGTTRRLHIGGTPGFRPDGAQKGRRVRCARPHFHVIGLKQRTTLLVPVLLQRKNDLLKSEHELYGRWRRGKPQNPLILAFSDRAAPSLRPKGFFNWSYDMRLSANVAASGRLTTQGTPHDGTCQSRSD